MRPEKGLVTSYKHWFLEKRGRDLRVASLPREVPGSPSAAFSTSPFSICSTHPSLRSSLCSRKPTFSQMFWVHRALLESVWAERWHSEARGGLETAEEQNWGRAREEGTFPLFPVSKCILREEGGEQKGQQEQNAGAAESPGARGLGRGQTWGSRLPTQDGGGEVWQHLFSPRAFPWATPARSPPFPLVQVTPPGPLGNGGRWTGLLAGGDTQVSMGDGLHP